MRLPAVIALLAACGGGASSDQPADKPADQPPVLAIAVPHAHQPLHDSYDLAVLERATLKDFSIDDFSVLVIRGAHAQRDMGMFGISCSRPGAACDDIQHLGDDLYIPIHLAHPYSVVSFGDGGPISDSVRLVRAAEAKPYDLDRTQLGEALVWKRSLEDGGVVKKYRDDRGRIDYTVRRAFGGIDTVCESEARADEGLVERELELCLTFEAIAR